MNQPISHPEATRGGVFAAAGFIAWGILPLYWKQMRGIPATELIAHRMVWSLIFLIGVLLWQKNLGSVRAGFASPRAFGLNLLSGLLLTANWLTYVWGVNAGFIIECSLGYFMTPLCNVALGYLVLHERPRPLQWAAIACAAVGVSVLLLKLGHFPWIALLWWHHTGEGALGRVDTRLHILVLSAGIITAIPLLMFAYGAQRVRLTTLGLLQYFSPTVQFLVGLFVYHEAFDTGRLQAFAIIWLGLILYTADSFWVQRQTLLRNASAG